ncbi:MAG: DUF547 domain-containing protein [Myxococcales bacterium]|nr:DUF547 domain-containing protein [Myxococcales bacterium]
MFVSVFLHSLLLTAPPATQLNTSTNQEKAQNTYKELLELHVLNGRIDYKALAKRSRKKLDRYLAYVASAELPDDRNLRLGFLVDAYNALVLKAVLHHNRPRSVLDIKGFFDTETHRVAGQKVTLDELEKKVLNPYAKDVRTHFVLVCGAVGCPILESQPFFGSNMNTRMETATRRYLASPFGARVYPGQVTLSKIFDWYRKDFGGAPDILKFVRSHLSESVRVRLGSRPKMDFMDYNWTLNQL